ncbi:restriction endonuclease subunit S [Paenibacillus antri]|uniref:Restriction endonuclease subunit S n=1 Tax=Paenibacillus antri TaxID=2582848 RepID=A0A5R9GH19_9BACL|nr:restriction endonuclease subunit S [Paenibacillus antri]TLS53480.1 restriction endonuclease subunit S [Paenibacillus antri]
MSARTKASLRMLTAAAAMQWCVADILEAKASEMETLRDWMLDTVRHSRIKDCNIFVTSSCEFHAQLIDLIHGITKMEAGLAKHVELMLVEEEVLPDNTFGDPGMLGLGGGGDL